MKIPPVGMFKLRRPFMTVGGLLLIMVVPPVLLMMPILAPIMSGPALALAVGLQGGAIALGWAMLKRGAAAGLKAEDPHEPGANARLKR